MAFKIGGTDVIKNDLTVIGISVSTTSSCDIPVGVTTFRPSLPATGSIRYNTDYNLVEYYNGTQWVSLSGEKELSSSFGRGVFGGGNAGGTYYNVMAYVTISTLSNSTDFGDLLNNPTSLSACASSTRGIFAGGTIPSTPANVNTNAIQYITIASIGNATDFGDLSAAKGELTACSSSTRGVFAGGNLSIAPGTSEINVIEYITLATTGNTTNFGSLDLRTKGLAACSSPTRGVFAGGYVPAARTNVISYITIATAGNATDFGDLNVAIDYLAACSSPTRGIFSGGLGAPAPGSNEIRYVTLDSLGASTLFGNLSGGRDSHGSCSSPTRGLFGGGGTPTTTSSISYVTIATTGDSANFGNLPGVSEKLSACSDSNGGLGL